MMMRHILAAMATLSLAVSLLSGCSTSPRVTYYTLNPAAAPETAAQAPAVESVAIGPVTLPEMLNRPHLVLRTAPNRVVVLETHRWAEPLKTEIPRVIADNLTVLLTPARVSSYYQQAAFNADVRVAIDFVRFEMTSGEGVTLDALWAVQRVGDDKPKSGRTTVREPAGGDGYGALVTAQSRALAVLSRDIAQAVRTLAAPSR